MINLFFLRYFYDAARLNSVTESARTNHVTQSAISQGISQLEKNLQVTLLTHRRNSLKLTAEGEILFKWSGKLFQQVDALQLELTRQTEYTGQLTLACSHSLAFSILPELLMEYRKTAPKIKLKVLFGHTGLIKTWIQQADVELGFVLDNDDLSAFSLLPLHFGAFRFFQSEIRAIDAPLTHCLFPPARFEVFQIKKKFLKANGYTLETEAEICSWEMIARIVQSSASVGFLPDYITLSNDKTSLFPCNTDLHIPYTLYLANHPKEILSRNALLFTEIASAFFSKKIH